MKVIALAICIVMPAPVFAMGAAPSPFTLSPVDGPKVTPKTGCRIVKINGKDHLSCMAMRRD